VRARTWRARAATLTLGAVNLGTLTLAVPGCGRPLSDEECGRLLDHYTELLISSDRPKTKADERDKLKAEARAKASRDPEFLRCSDEVSRGEFDCAMATGDVDSMERCLQ
jgi:hypothetical protein